MAARMPRPYAMHASLHDPTTAERRHDLDWVRIAAFGLLILYHVGMYYVSWDWHVKSPFASTRLEPLMLASSPWRLALLFFVSGTATACLLRRQAGGFVRSRARRLLIPLLFGMLVLVVPQAYFEVVQKAAYADGYLAFWARYLAADGSFCRDGRCLNLPTWNHLWFVAYLFVYSLLVWAAWRWTEGGVARLSAMLARVLSGRGLLLWPVAWLALLRLTLMPRFPSTHALVDDWYNHALYFSVFVLGWLLAREGAVWQALQRQRWLAMAAALTSYGFIAWYFSTYAGAGSTVPEALRAFQRVVYALNQWAVIVAVLGFATHRAPGDSAVKRYLNEAVFPYYILHQTVIIVVSQQLRPWQLAPALEGPLLIAATAVACALGFEIVRRLRWLRPLFGLAPAMPAGARGRPASIAPP